MGNELSYGGELPSQQGSFLTQPGPSGGPKPTIPTPESTVSAPETAPARVEGFVPAAPGHWRISLRVTLDYLRWVQGLADHLGLTVTRTVQAGLSNLAERHGYTAREPARFFPKRKCYRVPEVPPKSHG